MAAAASQAVATTFIKKWTSMIENNDWASAMDMLAPSVKFSSPVTRMPWRRHAERWCAAVQVVHSQYEVTVVVLALLRANRNGCRDHAQDRDTIVMLLRNVKDTFQGKVCIWCRDAH